MSKPVQTIIEDLLYFIKRYYSADEVISEYPQTSWADLNLAAYEKMGGIFVVRQYDSFSIILKDTEVDRIFNSRNDEMNAIPFLVSDQEFRNAYYSIIAENGFFLYSLNSFIKNGDSKKFEGEYPQIMDIVEKEKQESYGSSKIYLGYNLNQLQEITDLPDEDVGFISSILFQDDYEFYDFESERENWEWSARNNNGSDLRNGYLFTNDHEQKLWTIQKYLAPYVNFFKRDSNEVTGKVLEDFFPSLIDDIIGYKIEYENAGLYNANKKYILETFQTYFGKHGFVYDFDGDYLITTAANLMSRGLLKSKTYYSLPNVLRSIFKESFLDYAISEDVYSLTEIYSKESQKKFEEGLNGVFTQMLKKIESGSLKEGLAIREKISQIPELLEDRNFPFINGREIRGPILIKNIRPEDNKLSFLDYYGNLYVFSLEELLDLLKKS
jgi:hypothetical protein